VNISLRIVDHGASLQTDTLLTSIGDKSAKAADAGDAGDNDD